MVSLEATISRATEVVTRQLQRATKTGAWLTVWLSTVNGTELGAQEWRDAAFLCYGLEPLEPTQILRRLQHQVLDLSRP